MEDNVLDFDLEKFGQMDASSASIEEIGKANIKADTELEKKDLKTPETVVSKTEDERSKELFGLTLDELANLDPNNSEEDKNKTAPVTSVQSTNKNSETPSSSKSDTFVSLAKVLHEAGAILLTEEKELDEIKDVESLVSAITKTAEDKKFNGLNENQKNYLKALEAGVPLDVYEKKNADKEIYKNISESQLEENENLRIELIRRNFLLKGYDASKALTYAQRSVKLGEDLADSKEALAELKAFTEQSLQKEIEEAASKKLEAETKRTESLNNLKSKINGQSDIFPGIQINAQTKEKIYNSITTPVETKEGSPLNDFMKKYLENEEFKIKVHALEVITKGFTDFSKFINTKKSSAINELEQKLNSGASFSSTGTSGQNIQRGSTTKQLLDALGNIKLV